MVFSTLDFMDDTEKGQPLLNDKCTILYCALIINVAVNKGLYLVAAKLHNISATVGRSERMD